MSHRTTSARPLRCACLIAATLFGVASPSLAQWQVNGKKMCPNGIDLLLAEDGLGGAVVATHSRTCFTPEGEGILLGRIDHSGRSPAGELEHAPVSYMAWPAAAPAR